ncbi:MAG: diguanylate cyclase [Campylobacterota bacterium]|nr:diguanylate cyclase [Campylobacterota bacterium]
MINKSILKKINILYVEDEIKVSELIIDVLSNFVNNITYASDGKEGLELFKEYSKSNKLEKEKIHIIITDINMPYMDGLDMIENIYKIDNTIPTIITTAYNDNDFLKRSIELGVSGYVLKPLDLHKLLDSIYLAIEPNLLRNKLIKINQELESKIEEKTLELKYILDSQDSLIVVGDENGLYNANQPFLKFFNIENIKEFRKKNLSINDTFIKRKKYFSSSNSEKWIEEILKLKDINRIVLIKNKDNEERIFKINIKTFIYNTKHFVISLTDITTFQTHTNMLEYQATHDNLTKLFNRQKLNEEFDKEILRYKRYKREFGLIMFDIDDFKNINDSYGHDIGDIVLIEISKLLLKVTRKIDIVSRWGGEEFMILLPETSLENTITTADLIRKDIQNIKINKIKEPVTISLGVDIFNDINNTKENIIKCVDLALYKAKRNGKNRVEIYEKK